MKRGGSDRERMRERYWIFLNYFEKIPSLSLSLSLLHSPLSSSDAAVEGVSGRKGYENGPFRGLRVKMGVHTGEPICQEDPITGIHPSLFLYLSLSRTLTFSDLLYQICSLYTSFLHSPFHRSLFSSPSPATIFFLSLFFTPSVLLPFSPFISPSPSLSVLRSNGLLWSDGKSFRACCGRILWRADRDQVRRLRISYYLICEYIPLMVIFAS